MSEETKSEAKEAERTVSEPKAQVLRGTIASPLSNTLAIAGREFRAYFNSPMGYIIIGLFTGVLGILFFFLFGFLVLRRATLQPMFTAISWLMPLLCAAVSMRTFSEEWRTGTIELLITMPVRDGEVVLGKFLGALGLIAATFMATLIYPIVVSTMGDLDFGPVYGGYLGLLLGSGAYVALGMLVSINTRDQIVAFFITFFVSLLLFIMNKGLIFLPVKVVPILEYFCFDYHFQSIARGVVDSRNVIFFLSFTTACLLATVITLNGRRWR